MTGLRHHVPKVLWIFAMLGLTSGCYSSFRLSDPAPAFDAGVSDAARADAGRRDAGPRDAGGDLGADSGLSCPAARADFLCLESFAAEPERPFTLPLAFAICGCCTEAQCAVRVDGASRTLDVTTALCDGSAVCDCDGCESPVATCEVPALSEGIWTVQVNGSAAFTLPVRVDSGFAPTPPACVDFAAPSSCSESSPLPGTPRRTRLACVSSTVRGGGGTFGGHVLEVTDECGGCALESTCTVRLEPRLTDDLPNGGELYVDVNEYFDSCAGACPPVCTEVTRVCELPPLVTGDFYRVHVEGVPVFTYVAGSEGRTCDGRRAP